MSANFPQSWVRVLLNDVGEIVTGKTPSTKNPDNFGGSIPFIKPADLDNGGYVTRTADTLTEAGAKLVPTIPPNSIPVTCIGNLGKVGITNQTSATNQQINTVVPSSQVEHRFFYYQLQTLKPWMQENASATTVTIINKGKFAKAPVTLPSLAEQKVIADKLDTLLAQVENTKARLERIPQILKRFRQSLLAAAVSGRLTDDGEMGEESRSPTKLANLCTTAFDGPFGSKLKSSDYTNGGVGVVRLENIRHLKFDHSKETFISEDKYQTLIKNKLEKNDILFSSFVDEEVRACLFPFEALRFINKADCFCLRIDQRKALPEFVLYLLASQISYAQIKEHVQGVTRPRVNLKILKSLEFPVPPLEKQAEIVRKVNQLFAHADRIEQQVNNALARVNNLTQSILAKAFRGELTEQWRKDNPELISGENSAEALLEQIKAKRAAVAKPKRGKANA
jgi:type I restriction enzyme S subunit